MSNIMAENEAKTKYLYINTIGCQMNVYDSRQIETKLKAFGYQTTNSIEKADLIIVNTCSVRDKAEQKAFSFLGRLINLKRKKPALIIAVGGCVAQQEGEKILERVPFVDLVFGTRAINRLPGMLDKVTSKRYRIVDVELTETIDESALVTNMENAHQTTAFVTIMRGCDNYCTYCVVPTVRGREISRKPADILKEVDALVESGVREVTLLGQNVNSYGKKERLCTFPELLAMLDQLDGLERIRFTTSHPKDLSESLIHAFKNFSKLCNHIHLPVQSGSDRVLKRMNRKYNRQEYIAKIDMLRAICPHIAITSDIIVGFPGETKSDFKETLDLLETVQYDSIFAFIYSDRPNAPATRFGKKISDQEKTERLQKLLILQEQFTKQKNTALIGSNALILVEGLSKKENARSEATEFLDAQWTGRTSTNKVVNFQIAKEAFNRYLNETDPIGRIINVSIEAAFSHSLWGTANEIAPGLSDVRGGKNHAA